MPGRLLLAVFIIAEVHGCPYATMDIDYEGCLRHHPGSICRGLRKGSQESARKLMGAPGFPPLPAADISPANNTFFTNGILVKVYNEYDLVDVVAAMASGQLEDLQPPKGTLGKDMCIWSFQSLPPPPGADGQYHVPQADAQKVWDLCKLANDRFQAEIGPHKHEGVVVFGGCTLGARAAKDSCDFNLGPETNGLFCNNVTQSSKVNWPQSVTMFRVRADVTGNAALKSFMNDWRTLDKFHKQHITWAIEGGTGSPNGATAAGWGSGSGPGMARKVVPCDAIPSKFMYPNYTSVDSLSGGRTRTLMDEAYETWMSLCSIVYLGDTSACTFKYPDVPVAPTGPTPPPNTPGPSSQGPASCENYTADSFGCAQKVSGFGFNSVQEQLDAEQTQTLKACAQTMCDKWPGGGTVVQGTDQSWDCDVKNVPTNCSNGQVYMALRAARESCQMKAFLNISAKKLANANSIAKSATGPNAATIAAAFCQKKITCETDTVNQWSTVSGKTQSCTSFFDSIKDAYPWTKDCNQTKICKDYATAVPGATVPNVSAAPRIQAVAVVGWMLFGSLWYLITCGRLY